MKLKNQFLILLWIFSSIAMNAQIQLGQDIDGEAIDDQAGSVSLSADGHIVAIGAYKNDGSGNNSGHVRVYEYDSNAWQQLGQDIDGEESGDNSGWSVSLSADGDRVAIGAHLNDGGDFMNGHVRIFEYNISSNNWQQLGQDIDGEESGDNSGHTISISADGSRVAIGATDNSGAGHSSGHVRVYEYDVSNSSWQQLGQDIDGEAVLDLSGESVSLSSDDGNRVAIGASHNDGGGHWSGHVRVYEYNNSTWEQLGQDIDGEATGDWSGSVSLSADGLRLVIGAYANDGGGTWNGYARIYWYNNSASIWEQLGEDIDGEAPYDHSGHSVSISADGSAVAIGSLHNDGGGSGSGHVRIFQNPPLAVGDETIVNSTILLHPNPASSYITISNPQEIFIEELSIYDLLGSLVQRYNQREIGANEVIDISSLSQGIYMVLISSEKGQTIQKIVKE